MDNSKDVREFLMSRRARITPAQAGLPAYGGSRRVAGLKREEAAMLAGVSTEYYARSCPGATIGEGLAVRGEQVRDAGPDLKSWLRRTGLCPSQSAG